MEDVKPEDLPYRRVVKLLGNGGYRCDWQKQVSSLMAVEVWTGDGKQPPVLIQRYATGRKNKSWGGVYDDDCGINVFVPTDLGNDIDRTLEVLSVATGLRSEAWPNPRLVLTAPRVAVDLANGEALAWIPNAEIDDGMGARVFTDGEAVADVSVNLDDNGFQADLFDGDRQVWSKRL